MKSSSSHNKRWEALFLYVAFSVLQLHVFVLTEDFVPAHFRKSTTVAKHTGLNESDTSAESENEGATSGNPSDSNTGSASKGMNHTFFLNQDTVD